MAGGRGGSVSEPHHLCPILLLSLFAPVPIRARASPASPACIRPPLQPHRLLSVRFSSLRSVSTPLLLAPTHTSSFLRHSLRQFFWQTPRVVSSSMNSRPFGLRPEECPPKPLLYKQGPRKAAEVIAAPAPPVVIEYLGRLWRSETGSVL